jgi:hypothetical protein
MEMPVYPALGIVGVRQRDPCQCDGLICLAVELTSFRAVHRGKVRNTCVAGVGKGGCQVVSEIKTAPGKEQSSIIPRF